MNFETRSHDVHPKGEFEYFTCKDIETLTKSVKCHKAAGSDGIQPEHVKYAGQAFITVLTNIFNSIS